MQHGTAPKPPTIDPRVLTAHHVKLPSHKIRVQVAKGVDGREKHTHRPIPAMSGGILTLALECLRIRWLQIFTTRWLNANSTADLVVAELTAAVGSKWSFTITILHCAGKRGRSHGVEYDGVEVKKEEET